MYKYEVCTMMIYRDTSINTSCEAACYACGLPSYTVEFYNAILYSFINHISNENIRLN